MTTIRDLFATPTAGNVAQSAPVPEKRYSRNSFPELFYDAPPEAQSATPASMGFGEDVALAAGLTDTGTQRARGYDVPINYGAEAVLRSLFADKASTGKTKPSTALVKENCVVCHKLYIYRPRYGRHICVAKLGRKCALTDATRPCINGCTWACNTCATAAEEGQLKTKAKRDEYLAQRGIIEGGEQLARAMIKHEVEGDGVNAAIAEAHTEYINEERAKSGLPALGAIIVTPDERFKVTKAVAVPVVTAAQRRKRTESQRRKTVQKAVALAESGDEAGANALIQTIPREDRPFCTMEEKAHDGLREVFGTMPLSWILTTVEELAQTMPENLRDAKLRRAK